jgi:type IV secretory pathway TrbL component
MDYRDKKLEEEVLLDTFKSYRNVYRTPKILDLPLSVFWYFLTFVLVSLLLIAMMFLIGLWPLGLLGSCFVPAVYYYLRSLVKKYGNEYLDILMGNKFFNNFDNVAIRGKVEKLLR